MGTRSLCRIRMHEECGNWEEGVCVVDRMDGGEAFHVVFHVAADPYRR